MDVYEVSVESSFRARHAVALPDGAMEGPHEHDWRVRAIFRSDRLSDDGFVIDFVAVRTALAEITDTLGGADLNTVLGRPASAERVAKYLAGAVSDRCEGLYCLRVGEAPGCEAAVYPSSASGLS